MSEEGKKAEALVEMFYKSAIEECQADLLEMQEWLKKRIKKRCIE